MSFMAARVAPFAGHDVDATGAAADCCHCNCTRHCTALSVYRLESHSLRLMRLTATTLVFYNVAQPETRYSYVVNRMLWQ